VARENGDTQLAMNEVNQQLLKQLEDTSVLEFQQTRRAYKIKAEEGGQLASEHTNESEDKENTEQDRHSEDGGRKSAQRSKRRSSSVGSWSSGRS
jgi:hypothetical protein